MRRPCLTLKRKAGVHPAIKFHLVRHAQRCPWRIPEITRRWASGRGRDSAAATGTKKSLMASAPSQDLAVVLPSPSAHPGDHVFVDVDAECQGKLLRNSFAAPGAIAPFHFNDCVDQFFRRSFGIRPTDSFG